MSKALIAIVVILPLANAQSTQNPSPTAAAANATPCCGPPINSPKWSCAYDNAKRDCEWQFKQSTNGKEAKLLAESGTRYRNLGRAEQAREICEAALKLDSRNTMASECLTLALSDLQEHACKHLDELIKAADIELDRGEADKAIAIVAKIEDRWRPPK